MAKDERLVTARFPRSSAYNPDWVMKNGFGGNSLWNTEWLTQGMDLKPGMRVLDLGCGRALSSIFLAREFGVQTWAADLWVPAEENSKRIADAGMQSLVYPLHLDAHSLPFAPAFFDAITCVDCYPYFGTDDLYLNYLANFVKPRGQIGIAGAGLVQEISNPFPEHIKPMWSQDMWCLHSAEWWCDHWERTGIVDVEIADTMQDGWKVWLDWQRTAWPDNKIEIDCVAADQGAYLGYTRMVGRRKPDVKLEPYCWPDPLRSMPSEYQRIPLLRDAT